MDLSWQSNVSAFKYAIQVGHNFPSKEQVSFNFMATITICSDFGAQENKVCHCLPISTSVAMGLDTMILVFWMLSFMPTFSLFSFTYNDQKSTVPMLIELDT